LGATKLSSKLWEPAIRLLHEPDVPKLSTPKALDPVSLLLCEPSVSPNLAVSSDGKSSQSASARSLEHAETEEDDDSRCGVVNRAPLVVWGIEVGSTSDRDAKLSKCFRFNDPDL